MKGLPHLAEKKHLRRLIDHYGIDCIFDVGANYGQYAEMLRSKVGFEGLIVSFEPMPNAAKILREKSAGDPRWVIEELALSSRNGKQTFNIMKGSEFSSLRKPSHESVDRYQHINVVEQEVEVGTETLGSALARLKQKHRFSTPFLKMDTQGYDFEIISHAKDAVKEFVGLQSELAVKRIYDGASGYRDALALYESCGFQLSAFVPNNSPHFPFLIEVDCIMVRDGAPSAKSA
jgi:FkbM family methyltransferase